MGDPPRVGLGFDVHPHDPSRPLWLGGVRFDGEPGLAGHSDGDAVCHALADALLGAAAMGDLGQHFPEADPTTAGIGGTELLGKVVEMLHALGHVPASCDVTVICDRPAIAPRRGDIRDALARTIGVTKDRVSVKATRPEGLGLVGDGVGALAIAVLA